MRKLWLALLVPIAVLAVVGLPSADTGQSLGYDSQVFVVDADGASLRQITKGSGSKIHPAFSRDSKRVTYIDRGIRVFTLTTGKTRRLARTRDLHPGFAAWSPTRDELAIVYGSGNEDRPRSHIATIDAQGGRFKRLASWTGGGLGKGAPVWSPDGSTVVYARERARNSGDDPYCICDSPNTKRPSAARQNYLSVSRRSAAGVHRPEAASLRLGRLVPAEQHRDALAAADAQRHEPEVLVRALHLVQDLRRDHGAGGARSGGRARSRRRSG